ncbi:MAG: putative Fe2+ transport system protein, subunit B [Promethearchaeota archaeon]|nr:MAG: putative Fe2+ transport system protein, subunit B [Candidatus Lokiarchaeota archaeon]
MENSLPIDESPTEKKFMKNYINIALAGNPNVGKSVIFNQLTGLSQTIGNWPGKTVEKKMGTLEFLGYKFNIIDLPGIYSLSTYSLEEIVSREYIVSEDIDIIINVIDATNLERNLFLTFQMLELKVPMILAINQMDILRKRNIELDFKKLEEIFKIPVLPVVAVHGKGVHELLEESIDMILRKQPHLHYTSNKGKHQHHSHHYHQMPEHHIKRHHTREFKKKEFKFPDLGEILHFGKEIEMRIQTLIEEMKPHKTYLKESNYPLRFLAIKLLEDDKEIKKIFKEKTDLSNILIVAKNLRKEIEEIHGEDIHTIISSEIYTNINSVIEKVVETKSRKDLKRKTLADHIDHLTTHSIFGYLILALVIFGIYAFTFTIGDYLGGLLDGLYSTWSEGIYQAFGEENLLVKFFWDGGVGGLFGGIGGVLVYVIPFFLCIELLQDSGYLPRAAFLMDRVMHVIGVHGKAIIPMILGFGCNVPACSGCRIMETVREKKISVALTSLIPCAAVLTVVMGLVGRYLGFFWVVLLFTINFSVVLLIGRILNKTMPGQCTELIMEMHEYRMPNFNVIMKQTWIRSKEFIFKAMPIIIVLGISLEILLLFRLLDPLNLILSPITVVWLGLPVITGVFLIYGILRKELTLVLLQIMASSLGLTLLELLNPLQMFIFSLVTMLYIPCFATIIVIAKQTNWKYALQVSFLEIFIAILLGGVLYWGFTFFSLLI